MIARFTVLFLLVVPMFGTTAKSRLGDTLDQLTARYGPGSDCGNGVRLFHKQNWTITVTLLDGISAQESYQKPGGPTDEDIATLLSLNSAGQNWTVKPVVHSLVGTFLPMADPIGKSWQRDDGSFAYVPGGVAYCLTVQSKQLLDADAVKQEADKKAKESSLKGF